MGELQLLHKWTTVGEDNQEYEMGLHLDTSSGWYILGMLRDDGQWENIPPDEAFQEIADYCSWLYSQMREAAEVLEDAK